MSGLPAVLSPQAPKKPAFFAGEITRQRVIVAHVVDPNKIVLARHRRKAGLGYPPVGPRRGSIVGSRAETFDREVTGVLAPIIRADAHSPPLMIDGNRWLVLVGLSRLRGTELYATGCQRSVMY